MLDIVGKCKYCAATCQTLNQGRSIYYCAATCQTLNQGRAIYYQDKSATFNITFLAINGKNYISKLTYSKAKFNLKAKI